MDLTLSITHDPFSIIHLLQRYFYIVGFSITMLLGSQNTFGQTTLLSEGFEESGAFPPTGWAVIQGGTGNNWVVDNGGWGGSAHGGTYYAEYRYNTTHAANTWLISPGQSLTAGITYTISCWENTLSFSGSYPENLKMTVGTAQTIAGQTTTLLTMAGLTNESYVKQTVTYTPGASGTYYFGWQCYSAANENGLMLDDILIQEPTPCTAPTTQATTFSVNTITATSMKVNWTRGNGNNVMVIAGTSAPANPTSGTYYTAGAAYGTGTAVGGGFCVYNGTGTNVTVTGLTAATTYYYAIYEYNTTGTCYDLTALTGNAATTCTPPTTQSTIGAYTNNTTGVSLTVNWAIGNGNDVIVLARLTSSTATDPTSGTSYTANTVFGSGTQIGTGNYVVYFGAHGTTVNVTGLTQNTAYTFTVYEYATAGTCYDIPGSSSGVSTPVEYCLPSSNQNTTYINNFSTTGGVTNITNNGSGYTAGGYALDTASHCSQYSNSVINWSVTIKGSSSWISIWVDWNNNSVFTDAGEKVYDSGAKVAAGGGGGTTYTGSFTVPVGESAGRYRMRVIIDANATVASSCNIINSGGTFGEAEDYTCIVLCTTPGVPTGLAGTALGLTSEKLSWSAAATTGTPPVTYNWVLGTASGGLCGQTVVTNPVSPWVSPITGNINLYLWGGGGGGGGGVTGTNWGNGGGGGGGACSVQTFAVTSGQSYAIVYGSAGTAGAANGGNGGHGGTTTFIGPAGTFSVSGGAGGTGSNGSGAGIFGGGAGGSTGTGTVHSGGTGSAGNDGNGQTGNGGGGGGSTSNGTSPSTTCGSVGTGGTGAYQGGTGGTNANCSNNTNSTGSVGALYGGGGAGDNSWTSNTGGGAGGLGGVIITYGATVIDQGSTTNLSDTSYALTCGSTYWFTVNATTGCNATSSACAAAVSFTTLTCCTAGYAGPAQYICNTVTTATMAATGGGTWSQISGAACTITTPTSATTTITGLASGIYVFRWSCGGAYSDVMIQRQ